MCFCETNPPFSEDFFDATFIERETCVGNVRRISVGSFSKTNPPEGCKWGVLVENEPISEGLLGVFSEKAKPNPGNPGSQPGVKSACMRQLVRGRGAVVASAGI